MLTREIRQSDITNKKIAAAATIQARNKRGKAVAATEAPYELAMPQVRQRPHRFLSDSCVLLSPERNT
jgi:hypothetical protein